MKIVTADQMKEVEAFDYARGVDEESFMENVGKELSHEFPTQTPVLLLIGKGNNGGDALVLGRILLEKGEQVVAKMVYPVEKCSPLNQKMYHRFVEAGGKVVESFNGFEGIIVDALLGTGFHGELDDSLLKVIEYAQALKQPIFSVDIPSGVNGTTGDVAVGAIYATHTFFLGLPKWGCFLGNAWAHVGSFSVIDFGLSEEALRSCKYRALLFTKKHAEKALPPIHRTRHKYQAGFVVGLGGSPGMPGAPLLASKAALRSGAGIVRLLHPEKMEEEWSQAPVELIRQPYSMQDVRKITETMARATSLFLGPGFGTTQAQLSLLREILPHVHQPVVIDADALTLLATTDLPYPNDTILTPHHGEVKRLLAIEEEIPYEDLFFQIQEFVEQKRVTLVMKGAPTLVFHPGKPPSVLPYGDPGMATAGSGDVLTGVLAGILSQVHDPLRAAQLGVYLHAKSGEAAAFDKTSYCMIASDIIESLPESFHSLYHKTNLFNP
jgi:ADP-dependent NAD(P)H-hydrate dehydratase / NAD(P)H-hydrate epimerase